MKRFRMIGVALLAVSAFGVVMVTVAQAETAPYFTIGGTRLVAGKTHNIDARVAPGTGNEFTLTDTLGTAKISCAALGTEQGVLLGSNAESPGKDNEITVFSQCAVQIPATNCELVNAAGQPTTVITTEPLKSDLVENVENSKAGKKLYEEFIPANPANGFVTLKLKGTATGCEETIVSGQVVAEVLLDNANHGNVELGQTPIQATSTLLHFPNPAITQVWLITNGVGKIQKTKQVAFNETSIQTGEALVLLANTKFEPEPAALWSALP